MERAAAIVVFVLLIAIALAVIATVVGSLAAALTGTRVRWAGRIGLGIVGLFAASLALAITGLTISDRPARIGLAIAGAVVLVLAARRLRRTRVVRGPDPHPKA